ncbi:cytochrome c maturation protein CcmE [Acidimicrobiia bacterium EGI L10123]|uniref:cytochrome c maturation protein CcmE n=1 Tax=Salinilacustrithrix flava TaxID=2957203 RepID=UPI003D7C2093|nr:cytochrome c maturation protein CcmE [Acidimicrobiia bacterium EGI L10123]
MTPPTTPDPHAPFEDTDDVDGIDLTPRQAPPVGGGSADRGKRVAVLGTLGVLVVALVFMAYQGLNNATVFFRNVDEAVEQRDELGDKRFRLQGSVVDGSLESDGTSVRFAVEYGGVRADVVHLGDPPELFQPDIPVVLEGAWSDEGDWFASDRILVKHTEDYEAENPDRTDDYVGEGTSLE